MATNTDDFNRADGASLGPNWSNMTGEQTIGIAANQALANFVTDVSGIYTGGSTIGADQFAEVKLVNITTSGAGTGHGVIVRGSNSQQTYYGVVAGERHRITETGTFSALKSD